MAPSGYFTLQNPQRLLWFQSDSTPLKRGEPFNRTLACSTLGEGRKAHKPRWLRMGRAFAALLGCLRCQQPSADPGVCFFLLCPMVATLLFAACPSILGRESGAARWLLNCSWISVAPERSPGLACRSIP